MFHHKKCEMNLNRSFEKLHEFIINENYRGHDPFDGLNSKFFNFFKLNKIPFFRLVWIQFFKQFPINARKYVSIDKEYNAKGLGLFLSSYCNLYNIHPKKEYLKKIYFFIEHLNKIEVKGYSGSCWGYNFDWQSRAFFQPKNTPTVVASTFIGYALLDAYDILKDEKLLSKARSICNFILKDLNRTYNKKRDFCFSYSPLDKTQDFNASLLGSRLLSRVYSYTKEQLLIAEAKKSIDYCVSFQKDNGSWSYGTLPFHQWIDNFHTGYNLECISEYAKFSGDNSYALVIEKGFRYYLDTFFSEDGKSKYYNNALYPIDLHSPAQLIITMSRLEKFNTHKDMIDKVLEWTIINMQDKKGFFYYQKRKYFTNKIPYMRWTQAWMFFALTTYFKETNA